MVNILTYVYVLILIDESDKKTLLLEILSLDAISMLTANYWQTQTS